MTKYPPGYEPLPPRTMEQVMRDLNRRCGYPDGEETPPVKNIDPKKDPRYGTAWSHEKPVPVKPMRRAAPPRQDPKTCPHTDGVVKYGSGREQCRACGRSRAVGATSWKSLAGKKNKGAAAKPLRRYVATA